MNTKFSSALAIGLATTCWLVPPQAVADSPYFSPAADTQAAQSRTPFKLELLGSSSTLNGSNRRISSGVNFETIHSLELVAPYRNDITDGITTSRFGLAFGDRAQLWVEPENFALAQFDLVSPLAWGTNRKLKNASVHESLRLFSAGMDVYYNSQLESQKLGASLDLVSVLVSGEMQVLPRVWVDACSSLSLGATAGSNEVLGESASPLMARARASACLGVAVKKWGRLGYRFQWNGFASSHGQGGLAAGQWVQHEISASKIADLPLAVTYKNRREDSLLRPGGDVSGSPKQAEVVTHSLGVGIQF